MENLEKYFRNSEQFIIRIIAERLGKIANIKAAHLDSLLKLQNISEDLQAIKKNLAETIDKAKSEMYNIVESSAREYYEEAAAEHEGRFTSFAQNRKILGIVEKTKRESFEQFKQSLAFETIGFENADGEFKLFEQWYREIVNTAVTKVTRKEENIEEFIDMTLENIAEKGLMKYGD